MTVEDLIDIHAIEQLKYRYMRAVDTQDWSLLEQCFAQDAEVWYGDGLYEFSGRAAILEFFKTTLVPSFVSSHLAIHPEITLAGSDKARGVWRMQDLVHFTAPNPNARESDFQGGERLEGAGYYYDDYVKIEGSWSIERSGYIRLFDAVSPRADRPAEQLKVEPKRGVA